MALRSTFTKGPEGTWVIKIVEAAGRTIALSLFADDLRAGKERKVTVSKRNGTTKVITVNSVVGGDEYDDGYILAGIKQEPRKASAPRRAPRGYWNGGGFGYHGYEDRYGTDEAGFDEEDLRSMT